MQIDGDVADGEPGGLADVAHTVQGAGGPGLGAGQTGQGGQRFGRFLLLRRGLRDAADVVLRSAGITELDQEHIGLRAVRRLPVGLDGIFEALLGDVCLLSALVLGAEHSIHELVAIEDPAGRQCAAAERLRAGRSGEQLTLQLGRRQGLLLCDQRTAAAQGRGGEGGGEQGTGCASYAYELLWHGEPFESAEQKTTVRTSLPIQVTRLSRRDQGAARIVLRRGWNV